jgi:GTPase SAR1 family protein
MNEVEKHASDNISRILVGNKSDMADARQVSTDEGKELAEHYNVRFLETSAKDCKNVEEAFIMMTREIKSRVAISQPKKTSTGKHTLPYFPSLFYLSLFSIHSQSIVSRGFNNQDQLEERCNQEDPREEERLLLMKS